VARFPARAKRRNTYHHGHLRQALVDEAVATIRARGVHALTLREVGTRLRVSRTALYRHFADKNALLAAVATEGFRTFRAALQQAWDAGGHGREGFMAMGRAYLLFALDNPSHYGVMFGGHLHDAALHPELAVEGDAAFRVLVNALVDLQQSGLVRRDDPQALAVFVWATTHGTAMLVSGGQLGHERLGLDAATAIVMPRVWDGIAVRG